MLTLQQLRANYRTSIEAWMLLSAILICTIYPTLEVDSNKIHTQSDISIDDLSDDEINEIFVPKSRRKRSFIYPGTKWCGSGDIAASYEDLGRLTDLDACCRTHDHCQDSIGPGISKHGLYNELTYTSSHCGCDEEFRMCLQKTVSYDTSFVGQLYFGVAQCFNFSHPATCKQHSTKRFLTRTRCVRYEIDESRPKRWQFFDVKPWKQKRTKYHKNIPREIPLQYINEDVENDDIATSNVKFSAKSRQKRFIYSGTKWCGDGNMARSYDDLGTKRHLDMCCREHDHCNVSIPAKGSKYGLLNPLAHTSSHCNCDETFRACLHKINNFDTGLIGNLYFSITACINYTYPASCIKKASDGRRCLRYMYDTAQPKRWQFFDTLPWDYKPPHTLTPIPASSASTVAIKLLPSSTTIISTNTTNSLTTIHYTTATEPSTFRITSRASLIAVPTTSATVTLAIIITVLIYNKRKYGHVCAMCKKDESLYAYNLVATEEAVSV